MNYTQGDYPSTLDECYKLLAEKDKIIAGMEKAASIVVPQTQPPKSASTSDQTLKSQVKRYKRQRDIALATTALALIMVLAIVAFAVYGYFYMHSIAASSATAVVHTPVS